MHVLLINPPPPPHQRVSRGLMGGFGMVVGEGLCYPPLDLLYVGALAEAVELVGEVGEDGVPGGKPLVTIIDAEATGATPDEVMARLADMPAPALVLMATSSATIELDLELADRIKASCPTALVCITGSQGSKIPDLALLSSKVDAVVRGEPELTVAAMLEALAQGADGLGVDGLSVRRDGEIAHQPDRKLMVSEQLDALPFPARHLLPLEPYRIPTMEGPIQTIQSSRGCPINCTYCGYVVAQGIPWRGRSAASVFAECKHLVEDLGVTNVVMRDPLFAYDRARVLELSLLLADAGLGLKWQCETAIKTVDDELLEAMARGGCVSISFGVESGNEEVQKKYSRGKIKTHEHAQEVIDACRRHGIATRCFFMIGFPEETPAMASETIALALQLDPDTVQFTAVTPYPDTKLYRESMEKRGQVDFDYSRFTGLTPVGVAEAMTSSEVSSMIRRAYRSFYLRPSRIFRELKRPQLLLQRMRRYIGLLQTADEV